MTIADIDGATNYDTEKSKWFLQFEHSIIFDLKSYSHFNLERGNNITIIQQKISEKTKILPELIVADNRHA